MHGHYYTTKQRNNETAIFSKFFFLNTETPKETSSADIGSVEKFVASAKKNQPDENVAAFYPVNVSECELATVSWVTQVPVGRGL